jgi:hypothetical protein
VSVRLNLLGAADRAVHSDSPPTEGGRR